MPGVTGNILLSALWSGSYQSADTLAENQTHGDDMEAMAAAIHTLGVDKLGYYTPLALESTTGLIRRDTSMWETWGGMLPHFSRRRAGIAAMAYGQSGDLIAQVEAAGDKFQSDACLLSIERGTYAAMRATGVYHVLARGQEHEDIRWYKNTSFAMVAESVETAAGIEGLAADLTRQGAASMETAARESVSVRGHELEMDRIKHWRNSEMRKMRDADHAALGQMGGRFLSGMLDGVKSKKAG